MRRTVDAARRAAQGYAAAHFPHASAVLLGGSWARGDAHAESDLDVVIVDETVERVLFEGVEHEGWLVEACAINPRHVEAFFAGSAAYRSAPVPHQVVDAIVVCGEARLAEHVRALAAAALARGPAPLTDAERLDARYDLTLLRQDLAHVPATALPALAAFAHVQLSKSALAAAGRWQAERKALRRAVLELDPDLAGRLDDALAAALRGDAGPIVEACDTVLAMLGGPQRTYERFSA